MGRAWTAAFWTLWALLLASWVLALCGLASLQGNCYYDPSSALGSVSGVHGFTNSLSCDGLYRLYWFYIVFVFVTLVGLAITAATGWLAAAALSWMAWLSVLSALLILAGDSFLALRDVSSATTGGVWFSRAAATAAGMILSAIFSLGLAFLLGWRQRRVGGGAGGGAPIKF